MNAMKNIAIQLSCLLCLTAVLAGCAATRDFPAVFPPYIDDVMSGRGTLAIDGDTYVYSTWYGLKQDGKLAYSIIIVYPESGPRHLLGFALYEENAGGFKASITHGEMNRRGFIELTASTVDFNYVYFVTDGQIIARKSNEELGIDVSDPETAFDASNLETILTQAIREIKR